MRIFTPEEKLRQSKALKKAYREGRHRITFDSKQISQHNKSIEQRQAVSKYQKGKPKTYLLNELSPMWKGNKVSYSGLHKWIARKLGNANKCDNCGLDKIPENRKRFFQWANKNKKYLRELTDWIRLCVPCHRNFDLGKLELQSP